MVVHVLVNVVISTVMSDYGGTVIDRWCSIM